MTSSPFLRADPMILGEHPPSQLFTCRLKVGVLNRASLKLSCCFSRGLRKRFCWSETDRFGRPLKLPRERSEEEEKPCRSPPEEACESRLD